MINKIINLIKLNFLYKKKIIKIKINNKDKKLIKNLIKINIIKYIKLTKKNNCYIYLNYFNEKPIFKKIINFKKNTFINYSNLKKITEKNNIIFILNTNKGLISNFEAIKYKIGGVLVLQLWN